MYAGNPGYSWNSEFSMSIRVHLYMYKCIHVNVLTCVRYRDRNHFGAESVDLA